MEEATVVSWLKSVGSTVRAREPIVVVETEKSTVELESPADGVLVEITAGEGEVVEVSAVLAYVETEGRMDAP
jgi:pyruvate/2-oxoglutarate dehydrogenase complex dihydrolipoamide acyltransferase (E2) component